MKKVLQERILDAKIEITLRKVLDVAKKYFHELIIDVIKKLMTVEAIMVQALNTLVNEDEEKNLGQIFILKNIHDNEAKMKGNTMDDDEKKNQ